ncbi:MAG: biotin/lipoyl-containing protein, partial [Solirubrobacterales bacterium]
MAQTATVQIEMPEMGESVTEGIVLEWHVAEGDFVNEGDTVVEISTDKVDAEVPAPVAGTITKLIAKVDEEVPVGAPLAEISPGESGASGEEGSNGSENTVPVAAEPDQVAGGSEANGGSQEVRATPVARRVAEAKGVDLGAIDGSGPGSKVTKGDV